MGPYLIVASDVRKSGGMERANHALALHVARRGADTHLVAHSFDDELRAEPNIHCHQVVKPAGVFVLGVPLIDRVGRYWARRVRRAGGRVVVNGGNCRWGDVNWVHYVHAAFQPRTATSPLRRAKASIEHRLYRRDERLALARARRVIVNSDLTGRQVVEHLGVPESIVETVYLGTDPERFGPITADERHAARAHFGWSEDRPLVVFVGALGDRRKGFDVLFEAWRRLCLEPSWDADLVVAGTGAELSRWRQRAADAGQADRYHFLGYSREVPRVLAGCDAMVHPVRYESYGLGVQEALCRGLPTLVTATAGVAERYPSDLRDLLLPDPDDVEGLCERLRVWHDNMATYRQRVATLSDRLRSYTWDDMAARMLQVMGEGP